MFIWTTKAILSDSWMDFNDDFVLEHEDTDYVDTDKNIFYMSGGEKFLSIKDNLDLDARKTLGLLLIIPFLPDNAYTKKISACNYKLDDINNYLNSLLDKNEDEVLINIMDSIYSYDPTVVSLDNRSSYQEGHESAIVYYENFFEEKHSKVCKAAIMQYKLRK